VLPLLLDKTDVGLGDAAELLVVDGEEEEVSNIVLLISSCESVLL
jgi:hypothetical protein